LVLNGTLNRHSNEHSHIYWHCFQPHKLIAL
jgi:hypothetical protein